MVSFNIYRSTASGAYVEGVCLATDEKPITGIANGSILYAVDPTDGSTTRYMFDQSTATWIDAACPCSGGGSSGGGSAEPLILEVTDIDEEGTQGIPASFNELFAAYQAGRPVWFNGEGVASLMRSFQAGMEDGFTVNADGVTFQATDPEAPMSLAQNTASSVAILDIDSTDGIPYSFKDLDDMQEQGQLVVLRQITPAPNFKAEFLSLCTLETPALNSFKATFIGPGGNTYQYTAQSPFDPMSQPIG